jgi:hypothetical protein
VRSITTRLEAGDLEDEGVEGHQYFLLDNGFRISGDGHDWRDYSLDSVS